MLSIIITLIIALIVLPSIGLVVYLVYYGNVRHKLSEIHIRVNDSYTISELHSLLVELDSFSKKCQYNKSCWAYKVKITNVVVNKLKQLDRLK